MDRTGTITSPIKSEAEFARWLLAVLEDERDRLPETYRERGVAGLARLVTLLSRRLGWAA